MFNWNDKKRLAEQLKFFGAKKQGFISCYAKKPHIRIAIDDGLHKAKLGKDALSALYQNQLARGTERTAFGCNQMAMAQNSLMNISGLGQAVMGNALAGGACRNAMLSGPALRGIL